MRTEIHVFFFSRQFLSLMSMFYFVLLGNKFLFSQFHSSWCIAWSLASLYGSKMWLKLEPLVEKSQLFKEWCLNQDSFWPCWKKNTLEKHSLCFSFCRSSTTLYICYHFKCKKHGRHFFSRRHDENCSRESCHFDKKKKVLSTLAERLKRWVWELPDQTFHILRAIKSVGGRFSTT